MTENYTGHSIFMERAIEQARLGLQSGNGPVGCVIIKDGEVVVVAHNEENLRCDATAHAEMVAIQQAGKSLNNKHLTGCILYSTLEPCAMCSVACIWAGVEKIVYGARRGDVPPRFFSEKHISLNDLITDSIRPHIEIIPGVLEDECARLYN